MKRLKRSAEVEGMRGWLCWRLRVATRAEQKARREKNYGEAQYCNGLASAYAYAVLHLDRAAAAGPGMAWEEPKSRVRRRRRVATS